MKKLLLLLLVSFNSYADILYMDMAVYSGSNTGIYIDGGTEHIRFELPIYSDLNSGYAIKAAFNLTPKYKLWLGAGELSPVETIVDTSDSWERTTAVGNTSFPSVFIELEHTNGVFIRATHYDGTMYANFIKYGPYYTVGTGENERVVRDVVNSATVDKKIDETMFWVGYKWRF